jgi:hypothetical protein
MHVVHASKACIAGHADSVQAEGQEKTVLAEQAGRTDRTDGRNGYADR